MIKLIIVLSVISLVLLTFLFQYLKFIGQENSKKRMALYKSLQPQQSIIVRHEKRKVTGVVIYGNTSKGYLVNIGSEIINVDSFNFVGMK